jgi:hypothetical protein
VKKLLAKIILAISIVNLVIIPAVSHPISNPKNMDTFNNDSSVSFYYILKFDLSGKGEADLTPPAVFWRIAEGEIDTYSFLSSSRNEGGVFRRDFFKSLNITGPANGVLMFFRGTVDFDPETGNVEIHGSAIMGISVP